MSFLSPLFLAGALAVAVPIVIHFLRREPEARVRFAAVHMLQHAPIERADRRRLRQLLLLALRCLALLLLTLAFARPFFTDGGAAAATGVTMVALDTSLSMSAPGRFARAQQLARDAIAAAPSGNLVGVVTFADAARLAAAPSGDRAAATSAVDGARPGFGGTRYRAALSAAGDAIGARPGQVVVVSDLQSSGWDAGDRVELPSPVTVNVADVGGETPNLAVTAARRTGDRVIATVRNGGSGPREARVTLVVDGAPVTEALSAVGPHQSTDVVLAAPERGEAAEIIVDDGEGIAGDNVRYLVLSAAGRPSVLVITNAGDPAREAFYVQHALQAEGQDGAAFDVAGVSAAAISEWDAARLRRHAAVLLLSTRGLNQRGRELLSEFIQQGGGVLLAAGPDVDAEVASGAIAGAVEIAPSSSGVPAGGRPRTLAPGDVRHPVFRAFASDAATLSLVTFRQIALVRGAACQAPARYSTGEAAVLDCSVGAGRALVLGSDLDGRWNDFPIHATFLPFLHEATAYLAGLRSRSVSFTVGASPAGAPAAPGFGSLPDGDGARKIAVNVDPRESDSARVSVDEFEQAVTSTVATARDEPVLEARQQEERQNLWRYAILLLIATLVGESLLAARTA